MSWDVLGASWTSWGRLGNVLAASWGCLGASWGVLGVFLKICISISFFNIFGCAGGLQVGVLEATWGRFGGVLGASWGILGVSWAVCAHLERISENIDFPLFFQGFSLPKGLQVGVLEPSWSRLGGGLGASWRLLGASWGHLGGVLGRLGASWAFF